MHHNKTRKSKGKGRGSATRGWAKMSPGTRERRIMKSRCGSKCFLGPGISFPVCEKGTCEINRKGVQSAYNRARQYKHKTVAYKAKKLLNKMK
jgi:hypothetical protein